MRFELAFAAPARDLTPYVGEYVGWLDCSSTAVMRRELPSGNIPLIINFRGRVRERKAAAHGWSEHSSFAAGLHTAHTIVESSGPNEGLQVNFTALGARLFFDRPLAELTDRSVELDDLFDQTAASLMERLHDARSWERRFDILDREIALRIAAAQRPPREITWTWQQLTGTRGRARIRDLVREVGWSERHLASQFRANIGVTPKAFARTLRFSRAVRMLTSAHRGTLADIAQLCGYFDQAHFTREFGKFAGTTPSGLIASRYPAESGFSA
jgi:AraC-like DNA-binding protein